MKVRVLDRILILLMSLVFLAMAAGVAAYAWNLIPAQTIAYYVEALQGYWVNTILFTVAALALLAVSLRLFVSACRRDVPGGNPSTALIAVTENGAVTIALSTVQNLSKQYILTHNGVKTAHVFIRVAESGALQLTVKIAVTENIAIPELTQKIQIGLIEQLMVTTGLKVETISIAVDNSIAPRNTAAAPAAQ